MSATSLSSRKLCPLVKRPQKDCFCSNITSATIESAILFCMGDFERCDIYVRCENR